MTVETSPSSLDAFLQRSEDDIPCDLALSLDDSSTTASTESSGVKGDSNYYNYLRNDIGVYRDHSWTIHFYERSRRAGDSLWFRVWSNNEVNGGIFREFEDSEILQFVESKVQSHPDSCFYLKMTRRGGFTEFSLFGTDLIHRALNAILKQGTERDRLFIPSKQALEKAILRENRQKNGLIRTWLRPNGTAQTAGSR
ncbi:hypothetical protein FisN_32Hh027 [Fistulifera solaris]|uniref:Uncharacterized protein n=1 Tax=Fistulifera solaris TaxID=1519565 RepID=A0A1Z5K318_FISSO|nr:hypothetical protein FisN_32Hh027 [Fistulifera solaris]|eukprot:GAX20644.1 hypothetical protein FisN_32Hh027 [Fistulifera solaris]